MNKSTVSPGVVHKVSLEIKTILLNTSKLHLLWEDITPLARNEWLCWIESAKKQETRKQRIERLRTDLLSGKRRPCCWAGCPHRSSKGA